MSLALNLQLIFFSMSFLTENEQLSDVFNIANLKSVTTVTALALQQRSYRFLDALENSHDQCCPACDRLRR